MATPVKTCVVCATPTPTLASSHAEVRTMIDSSYEPWHYSRLKCQLLCTVGFGDSEANPSGLGAKYVHEIYRR